MTRHNLNSTLFYELLWDPALTDLWFPGDPRPAEGTVVDAASLWRAEKWKSRRGGRMVPVRLVPMANMRYPLAVHDDGLCDIDAREFAEGRRYEGLTPVALSLRVDGPRPEFTFAAGQMPIVSHRLAAVIESLCPSDVQRFPVVVLPAVSGYEILNVVATADCLDETRSEFSKFTVDDSVRPDRAGDYSAVARLRIDPRRTDGHGIFRVRRWEIALVVSDEVKKAMERFDHLGVVFEPVS